MKRVLIFLLMLPLIFAGSGWQATAALAIAVSLALLGALYGIGIGFGVNELQLMAKEELYQVIATAILVALLVGSNNLLDAISTNLGAVQGAPTLQAAAESIVTDSLQHAPDGSRTGMVIIYNNVVADDNALTTAASNTLSCSILQMGYSVSACGGYAMLAAPLSMAGGIVGFAVAELSSIQRLMQISDAYAMNLLLPLGLVLRTFKLTRGAGGLIIALGVSMYIMLPAGMLFNQMLVDTFLNPPNASQSSIPTSYEGTMSPATWSCSGEAAGNVVFSGGSGENGPAKDAFHQLEGDLLKIVFSVLVVGTLGPVLSLLMMVTSIRVLSAAAGAEVDVSAISRFV